MANAHIVFGVHKRDGAQYDSGFASQLVTFGSSSNVIPTGYNIIHVTVDANAYVAFSANGAANAAADPRVWIPGGGSITVSCVANTVVAVAAG